MKKVNLEQVFETLNEQRRKLNRCLGLKNKTYQQILSKSEDLSFVQKLKIISHLKSAQQLLTSEEYKKMWALPKFRSLFKIIEYVLYQLKHEPIFSLETDCFYLKRTDFESLFTSENELLADFVLLPYGNDIQVYEFIISGVFLKNMSQPCAENKAFIHSVETEFIAGFYRNKCFVIRIVHDIKQNKDILAEVRKRADYGLYFAPIQPQHFKFIQKNMLELRKKLTLVMEYMHNSLLPGKLGEIGLIDMVEKYPSIGKEKWLEIFSSLLPQKAPFSQKLWQKLATFDAFSGIFNGMKMMLQKYNGAPEVDKDMDYFYFLDDTRKTAIRIFWRKGWMAEVFVEYLDDIEFPVLTNNFVYIVKTVKNLKKISQLHELFEDNDIHFIWNG